MEKESSIYPPLPYQQHNAMEFRLNEIIRKRGVLLDEVGHRSKTVKRHRKLISMLRKANWGLGGLSLALGVGGVASIATVVGSPVGIVLESVSLGLVAVTGGLSFLTDKLVNKAEKQEKLELLVNTKLNSLSEIIGAALSDNKISENEFRQINNEFEKFLEMRRDLKATSKS